MPKFTLSAALAVAALGFATIESAHAQVIVNGGYSQGYYGGYSPGYYGGGIVPASGFGYNYSNFNYSSYPSYGYNAVPYSGYSNYSPALDSYYSFYRRGASGNNYNYGRRWR